MALVLRHPLALFGCAALLSVIPAAIVLLLPAPRTELQHLIAGTAAAAIWLMAGLSFVARKRLLGGKSRLRIVWRSSAS